MKSYSFFFVIFFVVLTFSLFSAEELSAKQKEEELLRVFKISAERNEMLNQMPKNSGELVQQFNQLSPKEQKYLISWWEQGVLAIDRYLGMYSVPVFGDRMMYGSDCPPSQMRYILMQLYNAPTIPDIAHGGILTAMVSCKDQTVIDLGRSIVNTELDKQTRYAIAALLQLEDEEITNKLIEYMKNPENDHWQREVIFGELWRYSAKCSKAEAMRRFNFLKEIAQQTPEDSSFYPFRNLAIRDKIDSYSDIDAEKIMAEKENMAPDRAKANAKVVIEEMPPLLLKSFISGVSSTYFMTVDQYFLEHDPEWQFSLDRYLILKKFIKESYDWHPEESVQYIEQEYAKLAPKYADMEKKLADAEAAYIAQYPDRAPQPIEK